jgi:ABC-type lipoprotein export system ATPase subunit
MQRVALARALIHAPRLLIADEPTGNLDSVNRDLVIKVLRDIHGRGLATLVVVTHEEEVAEAASRRLEMRDGRVVSP